jgi:hypothetical protein
MPLKKEKTVARAEGDGSSEGEEDLGKGEDGLMSATEMSTLPYPAKVFRNIIGLFGRDSDTPIEMAEATLDLLDTISRLHPAMRGLQDNPPDLSRFRIDERLNMYLANCLLCIMQGSGGGEVIRPYRRANDGAAMVTALYEGYVDTVGSWKLWFSQRSVPCLSPLATVTWRGSKGGSRPYARRTTRRLASR